MFDIEREKEQLIIYKDGCHKKAAVFAMCLGFISRES